MLFFSLQRTFTAHVAHRQSTPFVTLLPPSAAIISIHSCFSSKPKKVSEKRWYHTGNGQLYWEAFWNDTTPGVTRTKVWISCRDSRYIADSKLFQEHATVGVKDTPLCPPHRFLYNQKGSLRVENREFEVSGFRLRSAIDCVGMESQHLLFWSGDFDACSANDWKDAKLLQSCFRKSVCKGNANISHICYIFQWPCMCQWCQTVWLSLLWTFQIDSSSVLWLGYLWLVEVYKMLWCLSLQHMWRAMNKTPFFY